MFLIGTVQIYQDSSNKVNKSSISIIYSMKFVFYYVFFSHLKQKVWMQLKDFIPKKSGRTASGAFVAHAHVGTCKNGIEYCFVFSRKKIVFV